MWLLVEIDTAKEFSPELIWSAVSYPQTALWEATKKFNVSMSLAFKNATIYDVRLQTELDCLLLCELDECTFIH